MLDEADGIEIRFNRSIGHQSCSGRFGHLIYSQKTFYSDVAIHGHRLAHRQWCFASRNSYFHMISVNTAICSHTARPLTGL